MFAPDYNTLHAVKLDYDLTNYNAHRYMETPWYKGDSISQVAKAN